MGYKGTRTIDEPGELSWPWRRRTTTRSSRPTPTPARATRRTASTSTRSTSTTSTPGATSTRTRARTCATPTCASATGTTSGATPTRSADGVVGEVDLPEHRAAVLPELRAVRPAAEARGVRAPARRHPAPTTAGSSTSATSSPSAAPASARSSSTTSTTRSTTCTWIKEHGLRGGVLLPNDRRPTSTWVKPLYDPVLRPAVGGVRGPRRSRSTLHGGTGSPDYGKYPSAPMLMHHRGAASTRSARSCTCCSRGVFERFPRLKFVMTELGCAWVPPLLKQLDRDRSRNVRKGAIGELRYTDEHVLPAVGDRVLPAELLDRREPARPGRRRGAHDDRRRPVHVGQRLPARRGHVPVHAASTCARCSTTPTPTSSQQILAGNAAEALRLRPRRAARRSPTQYGPTVDEIAQPLTELPENPNKALLRGAAGTKLIA